MAASITTSPKATSNGATHTAVGGKQQHVNNRVDLISSHLAGTYPPPPLRTIDPPFILEEHPVDEYPPIRAIVIGAGIAGVTAGILLPAKVPRLELIIYERESDIGGVWHSNIYPGVRCDVASHVYQSTFSPTTEWTENYARGAEIKEYWKKLATKYNVWPYIQLNNEVVHARWSDERAKWIVRIRQKNVTTDEYVIFDDEAEFLITSTGRFSIPKLPDYPGINEYEGRLIHTSHWDTGFDPRDKRIALIGNGASGLQILPELQKVARHVDHYTRNPTWIAGTLGGEKLSRDVPIAEDLKANLARDPGEYYRYRKDLENQAWTRFAIVEKGGAKNNAAREEFEKLMAVRLGHREDLLPLLKPDFPPNCRRLTPGPGYLEALTQENVSYIRTAISSFTKTGIRTVDGVERPVDAILCATGADISCSTAFPIINGHGVDLQASWRPGGNPGFPDTYLGVAAAEFPNFLMIMGPNSGSGFAGTVPHTIENQVTYISQILRKVSSHGIRTITPSKAAVHDFRAYCESFFPTTVISEGCSSWYNNRVKGGRILAVWPGSGAHVNYIRRSVRWEDFEYTYRNAQKNRFAYFGNGWTSKDLKARDSENPNEEGLDFTPYLNVKAGTEEGVDLRGYHENWWEV